MYKKLEVLGSRLLSRFVPEIEASAATGAMQCWGACWQCNKVSGGPCRCNAPCCTDGPGYKCNCVACP